MTTSANRVRFNPNLYANVKVCLSILGTWSGPSWAASLTLESVALSVQSLMNERPFFNEPGCENMRKPKEADMYNDQVHYHTLKCGVCEMLEEMLDEYKRMPDTLKTAMQGAFPEYVDLYYTALKQLEDKRLHGTPIVDPHHSNTGTYDLRSLRTRLDALRSRFVGTENSSHLPNEASNDVSDSESGEPRATRRRLSTSGAHH